MGFRALTESLYQSAMLETSSFKKLVNLLVELVLQLLELGLRGGVEDSLGRGAWRLGGRVQGFITPYILGPKPSSSSIFTSCV